MQSEQLTEERLVRTTYTHHYGHALLKNNKKCDMKLVFQHLTLHVLM